MQKKEKTNEKCAVRSTQGLSNSQTKDSSGKIIFDDPVLCAQFLKGYVNIPMLKNVKPEDIEDVSNRYVHMFTQERNSDVVKRIWIKESNGEISPFYIISLIEHKNKIDYNVTMQILRYMVYIWEEYEKEMEKKHTGISKTKNFRYPPVLPIIFYDGASNWTASTQLKERIYMSDTLLEYIPDYNCILVQLKDYSNVELMKRKDELSVVMMIDRLQNAEEFADLEGEVNPQYIQEAVKNTPEYLLDIMAQIVEVFLAKLNVPQEEVDTFASQIKERKMAELFANFKGYDVQAARAEAREKGYAEGREEGIEQGKVEGRAVGRVEGRAEGRAEGREIGIGGTVKVLKKHLVSKEQVVTDIIEQYDLTLVEAEEMVKMYWE